MRNHDFFGGGLLREHALPSNTAIFYTSHRDYQELGAARDPGPGACPLYDSFDLSYDIDLEAESIGRPIGEAAELAVRVADAPTPDYVQILLVRGVAVTSGNAELPCELAREVTIAWEVSGGPASAFFPFGATETIDVSEAETTGTVTHDADTKLLVDGEGGSVLSSYLRRAPDAGSYVNPGNAGVDTLIPWAEFVATPSVHLGLTVTDGWYVTDLGVGPSGGGVLVAVRLWFKVADVQGQIAVVGSA